MDWMGWIYLRSLVLKEHRQSDANNIWFLPNMVWNDGMWYGMVRYGIFQYGMVWYTMVWYDGMAKSAADTLPRFCLRCSFPPVHPLPHELAASWQQNRWKQTNKQTNKQTEM